VKVTVHNVGITVEFTGRHDQFPAYEGVVEIDGERHLVYRYMPNDTGPSLFNLLLSKESMVVPGSRPNKQTFYGVSPRPSVCTVMTHGLIFA